jgi:hypothetical protein
MLMPLHVVLVQNVLPDIHTLSIGSIFAKPSSTLVSPFSEAHLLVVYVNDRTLDLS